MSTRVRWLATAAVVFGVIAASVAALVVPTRSEGEGSKPDRSSPIVVLPKAETKLEPGMIVLVPEPGTVRIERQVGDPRGGPPFALRVFRAKRVAPYGQRPTPDRGRLLGHELCAQLGRVHQGQFGWLDARNRFRPAGFGYNDTPLACGDRWNDQRSAPQVRLTTLISDPSAGRAAPVQGVAWGFGGPATRRVSLNGAAEKRPATSARGAFLVAVDAETRADSLSATFEYRGRATVRLAFRPVRESREGGFQRVARGIAGTGVIEARTPDPGGGLPWGVMSYRVEGGGYCGTQPARIVGDRVGSVNFRLDTFDDSQILGRRCSVTIEQLPAKWPAGIGTMFGGAVPQSLDPTAEPERGRIALRTLPGRTVIYGVARSAVRSVTIESPRDVRTLVPSPRAHSLVVVYDGAFPTGHFKLTATMADGSQQTVTQPAGFG